MISYLFDPLYFHFSEFSTFLAVISYNNWSTLANSIASVATFVALSTSSLCDTER